MIRRDYIMRLVAELVQVLARVISLKQQQAYEAALREIDLGLRQLRDPEGGSSADPSLEDWIAGCRRHGEAASGLMVAVADLLREQGEIFARQDQTLESHRARVQALGLLLEALLNAETFVSAELLAKVDQLLEDTSDAALPAPVCERLFKYFEARGHYAKAEDALFTWLETRDQRALAEGPPFYRRLLTRTDAELELGGLPRAEVDDGANEFLAVARRYFPAE